MNMSVTQFAAAPALVGRNRSLWRQVVDTVIEGPPRTTADKIAGYLTCTSTTCRRRCGLSLRGDTYAYKRRKNPLTTPGFGRIGRSL